MCIDVLSLKHRKKCHKIYTFRPLKDMMIGGGHLKKRTDMYLNAAGINWTSGRHSYNQSNDLSVHNFFTSRHV